MTPLALVRTIPTERLPLVGEVRAKFCRWRVSHDRLCGLVVLQIQRSGFDSRSYQIFWEIVGLDTTEELAQRKSSLFGLENRDYGRRATRRWPRGILYTQRSALTSSTSGGRPVGTICSLTKATVLLRVMRGRFPDRSRYSFLEVAPQLYSRAEGTPFQAPYFSQNLVSPGIEPGFLNL
jgi:hypothetical protein